MCSMVVEKVTNGKSFRDSQGAQYRSCAPFSGQELNQVMNVPFQVTSVPFRTFDDFTDLSTVSNVRLSILLPSPLDRRQEVPHSLSLSEHVWALKGEDINYNNQWGIQQPATKYQNTA